MIFFDVTSGSNRRASLIGEYILVVAVASITLFVGVQPISSFAGDKELSRSDEALFGALPIGQKLDYRLIRKIGKPQIIDGPYGDKTFTYNQDDINADGVSFALMPIKIELVYFNLYLWAATVWYRHEDESTFRRLVNEAVVLHGFGKLGERAETFCWRNSYEDVSLNFDALEVMVEDLRIGAERSRLQGYPNTGECDRVLK